MSRYLIFKKTKTLNAYSLWQDYARTKIQLSSERSDSALSFKAKKPMCSFKTVSAVCLWSLGSFSVIYNSQLPQVLPVSSS